MTFDPVTDMMIDTEFLSFKYDSYLMSIGVVIWDIDEEVFKVSDRLHVFPSIDSQPEARMDKDTLMWWLGQSPEPRKSIVSGQARTALTLRDCLVGIARFIQDNPSLERIWSHGACCDLPLLKHQYDKLNLTVPWGYKMPRDTYTLFDTVGCTPEKNFYGGVAHDALADAIAQAEQVHTAWKLRRIPNV